jgi:hypothetical protein
MPSSERQKRVEEWRQRIHAKSQTIQEVASTPAGRKMLDLIYETFLHGDLKRENPYETYYALGQRDLAEYLKELEAIANGGERAG